MPAAPVVTQKNALYSASLYPKHSSHSSQIVIFDIRWLKQGQNTLYTEGNVVSITLQVSFHIPGGHSRFFSL